MRWRPTNVGQHLMLSGTPQKTFIGRCLKSLHIHGIPPLHQKSECGLSISPIIIRTRRKPGAMRWHPTNVGQHLMLPGTPPNTFIGRCLKSLHVHGIPPLHQKSECGSSIPPVVIRTRRKPSAMRWRPTNVGQHLMLPGTPPNTFIGRCLKSLHVHGISPLHQKSECGLSISPVIIRTRRKPSAMRWRPTNVGQHLMLPGTPIPQDRRTTTGGCPYWKFRGSAGFRQDMGGFHHAAHPTFASVSFQLELLRSPAPAMPGHHGVRRSPGRAVRRRIWR